ncbi:SWIM zinc finger domain-containing protein [Rheinheimera baltica]|uniref:SWIM zinc finger domain-containing protein n=1 Tax=Rheinheimera baltica TaxID=67576 RepID=A0ABT9HV98_9GAMM|nr:SWIM zinc finger family protein [Rheinheimera baltica]MDP5135047.1 SWIM zinc finger domain-containing protein [Rheinheimera baltica]
MDLSLDAIQQFAPDDASAKAAKALVIPAKWPKLQYSEAALWGECQGSGAKPYLVQIDKSGPAFKCSCPSRKFPCKHGLALMLLWLQHQTAFANCEPPAWVCEWLNSRQSRAEKQETKKAEVVGKAATPTDPLTATKREAARRQRMAAGLTDLQRWLADNIRQGLVQLSMRPREFQEIAKRMVDAQLPGIAQRLRQLEQRVGADEDWPARILAAFGQLQLLIDGFQRLDSLPEIAQADLRTALGLSPDKDVVLASGETLTDTWLVLGQRVDEEDRLWVRRVWLQGRDTGRRALLLDFSHGTRRFDLTLITGTSLKMTLTFYPGSSPLRALVVDTPQVLPEALSPQASPSSQTLTDLTNTVAANPWQWPLPMVIDQVVPTPSHQGWQLVTSEQQSFPLRITDQDAWPLIAEAGGAPVTIFGEWDGEKLRPLSAWSAGLVWQEGATNP